MSVDTGGWGAPAGVHNYCTGQMEFGGIIWYGDKFPTEKDFENLLEMFPHVEGNPGALDWPTLFGRPSHRDRVMDLPCYQPPVIKL